MNNLSKFDLSRQIFPVRYRLTMHQDGMGSEPDYYEGYLRYTGDYYEVKKALKKPFESFKARLKELTSNSLAFWKVIYELEGFYSQAKTGAGGYFVKANKVIHCLSDGPVVKFDAKVLKNLSQTDISLNVPVSQARPPYPLVYLAFDDFKDQPQLKAAVNGHGVDADLEGAYVSWSGDAAEASISVVLIGKPAGGAQLTDSPWVYLQLPSKADEVEYSFGHALAGCLKAWDQKADVNILSAPLTEQDIQQAASSEIYAPLMLVMRCLYFLNWSAQSIELRPDLDKALTSALKTKGGHSRQKALRQAYRQSNQIIIRGKDFGLDDDHDSEGNSLISKSVHWRRGHFRNAAVGPGRQEAKVVWVRPTLVNREKLAPGEEAPAVKEYLVTQ